LITPTKEITIEQTEKLKEQSNREAKIKNFLANLTLSITFDFDMEFIFLLK